MAPFPIDFAPDDSNLAGVETGDRIPVLFREKRTILEKLLCVELSEFFDIFLMPGPVETLQRLAILISTHSNSTAVSRLMTPGFALTVFSTSG